MKSIQLAPVDTFICLRSTTPLILAVWIIFLREDLPSAKSFASLIGIAMGVVIREYRFKFFCAGVLMDRGLVYRVHL